MNKLTALMGWIDDRFPMTKMWEEHLSKYYAPKNFNFWYFSSCCSVVISRHDNAFSNFNSFRTFFNIYRTSDVTTNKKGRVYEG